MIVDGIEYVKKTDIQAPAEVGGLKYAIVRANMDGVCAGFVKSQVGQEVVLINARRLWEWSSSFVLEDLAEDGPTERWNSKYSKEMSCEKVMSEACGILYCTEKAMIGIRAVEATDQTNG